MQNTIKIIAVTTPAATNLWKPIIVVVIPSIKEEVAVAAAKATAEAVNCLRGEANEFDILIPSPESELRKEFHRFVEEFSVSLSCRICSSYEFKEYAVLTLAYTER